VEDRSPEEDLSQAVNCSQNHFQLAPSPVDVDKLHVYAHGYDNILIQKVVDGFKHGFPICYTGPRVFREAKNLKSAVSSPDIIKHKISAEVLLKRVAGPFQSPPFQNMIISPLGLVPKKVDDTQVPEHKKFRMIHHLSWPDGLSVNDFIEPVDSSVHYSSFDQAVGMIQRLGKNCKLFKADIKDAFRLIPIRPQDFELLGFKFENQYYFDKCLPFGAASSCKTFEMCSSLFQFCVEKQTPSGELMHYLDDYLGGDYSTASCANLLKIFLRVMSDMGVIIAKEKTQGPTEVLVFLGLELDSNNMSVRIPQNKIDEVILKIHSVLSKNKSTLKEMQSLIGSLNFCCRAIPLGRPYCRRLLDSICGLSKPYHHIRVKQEIKKDLSMWLEYLRFFNGVSIFHDQFWVSSEDLELFTDSAGGSGLGYGAYFQGKWFNGKWPAHWHTCGMSKDITFQELFPIVASVFVWGDMLKDKKIRFNCEIWQ